MKYQTAQSSGEMIQLQLNPARRIQDSRTPSRSRRHVTHEKGWREEQRKCFKLLQPFAHWPQVRNLTQSLSGPSKNQESTSLPSMVSILQVQYILKDKNFLHCNNGKTEQLHKELQGMPPIDLHTLHTEHVTKMQERKLSPLSCQKWNSHSTSLFPSQRKFKIQLNNNKRSII